jgi:hypothetical protein
MIDAMNTSPLTPSIFAGSPERAPQEPLSEMHATPLTAARQDNLDHDESAETPYSTASGCTSVMDSAEVTLTSEVCVRSLLERQSETIHILHILRIKSQPSCFPAGEYFVLVLGLIARVVWYFNGISVCACPWYTIQTSTFEERLAGVPGEVPTATVTQLQVRVHENGGIVSCGCGRLDFQACFALSV